MRPTKQGKIYMCLILLQIAALAASAQQSTRTLIRTGHLLDVKTGAEPAAQTIIVTGDRITAIAPTASTPKQSGDTEIDLTRYTVMPGLIDVHTHLTMANNFDPYWELSMTPAKEAIIGVENAKVTLEAGFTTVRHMDQNLLPYEYHVHGQAVADGIPAVQHQVRENIKYGADLIKIASTGGVLSKGDDPQASQYTMEELQAIVADAHRLGRKVASHTHGAQGILWASEAGVDSIEHGSYLNDEGIAMMKKHGTYLVPTAYLVDWMQQYGKLPPLYQQKM